MLINNALVRHGNAAALLPSVLQGKKSVVAGIGRVEAAVAENAEDAALLVQAFLMIPIN